MCKPRLKAAAQVLELVLNARRSCGSGKRFKHCCGNIAPDGGDSRLDVSDADLLDALKRADDVHIAEGMEPGARSLFNLGKALEKFGITSVPVGSGGSPFVERARRLGHQLFVPKELQTGGLHLGAFLFRDMFCRLYAPIAMGRALIDFWRMIDLNDDQKQWIAADPADLARFTDQAADILDFGYGWKEFGHGRSIAPRARELIWRAHVQLEAAAATATSAYDFRGTIQSALLGTELALKAGLSAHGVSDIELKSRAIGHDLSAAAQKLATFEPDFDCGRVLRVVANFPHFVESRYDTPSPSRMETGHILMGAQYVASEVTRRFTDRDAHKEMLPPLPRTYPA